MKTFDQLNETEQTKAIASATADLLTAIIEGSIRFNDALNHDTLQKRIDKALRKADRMQTPWFAHEYLMEDTYIRDRIEDMARCDAEDAFYSEPHERVIRGIAA